MSEIYPETPAAPTFGRVYWDTYVKHDVAYVAEVKFDDLHGNVRAAIEAGAQAVAAHVANPTAEDFDRAAEEIAKPAVRYALVEQMGHRATYAAIREATFLGEPMLEVTALNDGSVHLVSPKSIFEVTLMPEDQARNLAARTTSWTAVAIPAGNPWGSEDLKAYEDDSDPDEGKDDGMSASERAEYDRDAEFALDAADEARDLEREAEAHQ